MDDDRGNILEFISKCVHNFREHPKTLELEIRVGKISSDFFQAGYKNNHKSVILRLIERLIYNSKNFTSFEQRANGLVTKWSMQPKMIYSKSFYKYKNYKITRISIANKPESIIKKRKLKILTIETTRPYDIRIALNEETNVNMDKELSTFISRSAPNYVSVHERASFIEEIKISDSSFLTFRYDITKVSPPGLTKNECTNKPCSYHCEVELIDAPLLTNDKNIDKDLDDMIAELFLKHGLFLLGTHVIVSKNNSTCLSQPKIQINKK